MQIQTKQRHDVNVQRLQKTEVGVDGLVYEIRFRGGYFHLKYSSFFPLVLRK